MKRLLVTLVAVCSLSISVLMAPQVLAEVTCPEGTVNKGKPMNSLAECDITISKTEAKQVSTRIETAINVVLSFVGVAATAVIILGGIQYITSQGDAAKAAKARNVILYGVVGLIICLLAFAIVNLVLTGVFTDV